MTYLAMMGVEEESLIGPFVKAISSSKKGKVRDTASQNKIEELG